MRFINSSSHIKTRDCADFRSITPHLMSKLFCKNEPNLIFRTIFCAVDGIAAKRDIRREIFSRE